MTTNRKRPYRRALLATACLAVLTATALIVPSGTSGAQGATDTYAFATFDAPTGNTLTGEINGIGFTMEADYFQAGITTIDPVTAGTCDLSTSDFEPAGPETAECAQVWARSDLQVTFDAPVEGLRLYLSNYRGEGADGGDEYLIYPNDIEDCDPPDPVNCWSIQSGLPGTDYLSGGYLETASVGLINGILYMGPDVESVNEFAFESYADGNEISLMGLTFAAPSDEPAPTSTTTAPPQPTTTLAPAGPTVGPRFTG